MPDEYNNWTDLFPHKEMIDDYGPGRSHNELLVELAGRKCYDSFGLKAGKKSNKEYIANTQLGEIPHASIMYHAKMTFFIAGVSRRLSQELFRNYVGADRDVEGSPSQESSRFTHHYGYFVAHPTLVSDPVELAKWKDDVQEGYDRYLAYIDRRFKAYEAQHGKLPTGMDRKRIYESSIGRMPWDFETSFIWTTNPVAIAKFIRERKTQLPTWRCSGLRRNGNVSYLNAGRTYFRRRTCMKICMKREPK